MSVIRLLISVLLLVVLASSLAVCQRGQRSSEVMVDIVSVEPSPPQVGPAELRLRLRDERGQTLAGLGSVEVEGTMSHAGMKPVIVQAREEGDGVYRTENFEFTMAGDWIIIVRGTRNGQAFEARTTISGVRSSRQLPTTPGHDHSPKVTPTP
uniref:YtkA-like domain-containing protein n=1 Tax=Thermomicrobium roseum TaxID=500 RepID=A0A7C5VXR6_THERO